MGVFSRAVFPGFGGYMDCFVCSRVDGWRWMDGRLYEAGRLCVQKCELCCLGSGIDKIGSQTISEKEGEDKKDGCDTGKKGCEG